MQEITATGATLIAISPQRPVFLKQIVTKNHLTFDVLSDSGNAVAAEFGLRFQLPDYLKKLYQGSGLDFEKFNGDSTWTLPMPARFIIDRKGIIRYAAVDPDYTVRPEPADTVIALKEMATGSL